MPEITEQNQEKRQAAELRQQKNQARSLDLVAKTQSTAGNIMQGGGRMVDQAGKGLRKGGSSMMRAGAELSTTGLGAVAGVPLMAAGAAGAATGIGAQGAGKASTVAGKTAKKGGKIAKLKSRVLQKKSQIKKKSSSATFSLAREGTDHLLRAAWLNLIPSWGLSLFYINTHVFLSWLFPKQFCSLGQEWPQGMAGGKSGKKVIGIGESLLLAFLNLVIFFLIFAIIALIFWFIDLNVFQIISFIF